MTIPDQGHLSSQFSRVQRSKGHALGLCTISVAKTKTLISCAVTAQLISAFVFAYADCWFSNARDQMIVNHTEYFGKMTIPDQGHLSSQFSRVQRSKGHALGL